MNLYEICAQYAHNGAGCAEMSEAEFQLFLIDKMEELVDRHENEERLQPWGFDPLGLMMANARDKRIRRHFVAASYGSNEVIARIWTHLTKELYAAY